MIPPPVPSISISASRKTLCISFTSLVLLSGLLVAQRTEAQQAASSRTVNGFAVALPASLGAVAPAMDIIDIGQRRELFIDGYILEKLTGEATLRLHHPVPQEVAILHDAPWEGNGTPFHTIFRDGPIYRMYYFASQKNEAIHGATLEAGAVVNDKAHYCYAESVDGIHWTKPALGLHEFRGSKSNNIVFVTDKIGDFTTNISTVSVFKDEALGVASDALYKAFVLGEKPDETRGLMAFKSPDGFRWSPMHDTPVITHGRFDSQNLAFWDPVRGEYRAYWRYSDRGTKEAPNPEVRAIRTATSKDFIQWENEADLTYVDSPREHIYTNQIRPYYRAPHLFIGFPVRYIDRGWSASMRALPDRKLREKRSSVVERYGTALTESLIMASRDGISFKRWNEAFLRPGIERPDTWVYSNQYIGWGIVETKSALEGAPNEMSIYASESQWTGTSSQLRRYTLRLDGFVSLTAPMRGGEAISKPLRFQGAQLLLNFATSAAGSVRVEIQDIDGQPLPGFSLGDCPPLFGDTIERPVTWTADRPLNSLDGKIVRLRFVLEDADVFAFQFRE